MTKLVVCIAAVIVAGCGSAPPPKTPEPSAEPEKEEKRLVMHGELGVLDEKAVRTGFEKVWRSAMTDCQKQGGDMISGHTLVRMRVNHSGAVKWVYFKETDLGDRNVEKCMLDALRNTTWPIPEGGEDGIAEQELPFADYAARGPDPWDPNKVKTALSEHESELTACRNGITGTFVATAIVNKDGSVASVGMQQPDETADDAADCMVEIIKGMKLPKTGSWVTKVSFEVP